MKAVQQVVNRVDLPAGIRVAYGGGYEEQQRSFRDLVYVLVLAVLLVSSCCYSNSAVSRRRWRYFRRRCCLHRAFFWQLLAIWTTFNISSFMGLIMVIGIVAKNGILVVDADQKFRGEGTPAEESMIRAGERRLRPIMMTALAILSFLRRHGL
jgi:multidrug efflux pump subunit AcrB